jgi:hypothetical protein
MLFRIQKDDKKKLFALHIPSFIHQHILGNLREFHTDLSNNLHSDKSVQFGFQLSRNSADFYLHTEKSLKIV